MIALLTIVFISIAFLEIPPLIKKKYWYDLGVFLFFLSIAGIISLLTALDINIPSPTGWVVHLLREILHISYN